MVKFWFNRIFVDKKATLEDCPARYREAVREMALANGFVA